MPQQGREQQIRGVVKQLVKQFLCFRRLHHIFGNQRMAQKIGFPSLNSALGDALLDNGIGGVHVPANVRFEYV